MSQIFKKHYTGFQRHILKEFLTEKELNKIDKKYNEAKKELILKRMAKQLNIALIKSRK